MNRAALLLADPSPSLRYLVLKNILEEEKTLPEDFFDNLANLLHQIHQKSVLYIDMNKLGNIIIGTDGKAYLIDFQISLYFNPEPLIFKSFTKRLQKVLQNADLYHLFKHKRRLSPESLRPEEEGISRPFPLIQMHRCIANPYRHIRRKLLDFLRDKGLIHTEDTP